MCEASHQAQGLVADQRLFGSAVSWCVASTLSSVTAGVQLMRSWLARGTRQMEYDAATRWLDKLFLVFGCTKFHGARRQLSTEMVTSPLQRCGGIVCCPPAPDADGGSLTTHMGFQFPWKAVQHPKILCATPTRRQQPRGSRDEPDRHVVEVHPADLTMFGLNYRVHGPRHKMGDLRHSCKLKTAREIMSRAVTRHPTAMAALPGFLEHQYDIVLLLDRPRAFRTIVSAADPMQYRGAAQSLWQIHI